MFFCKVQDSCFEQVTAKKVFLEKIYIIFVKLMLKTLANSVILAATPFEHGSVCKCC